MSEAAATEHAENALVGRVLADRYRVESLLGSGGMGSVYRAEHVLMKKAVALKVLHREMTYHPEVVARFEREAIAAARIDHPNVAAAMDCGRLEDGSFYIVLEYVDGKSLRTLIEEGPLDVDRALGIAAQIADALAAAHAAGIVHRDLKPDNVMLVSQAGAADFAKVLDFGIAKVDGSDGAPEPQRALTRIGAIMGTAGYMAPEQALGQTVDARADLYAFGVLLYEMISGKQPYVADEAAQILAKQLTEHPPPLPERTPPELSSLIDRLLEKSPDDRIQTARELSEAIGRVRGSAGTFDPATVLDVDGGGLPKSARTTRSTDDSAATLDVADGKNRPDSVRTSRQRKGAMAAFALLLASVLGAALFWRARKSDASAAPFTLSSATAALLSSLPPLPVATPSASAAPIPAEDGDAPPTMAREEGPGTAPTSSASTHTSASETKSTRTDGHTVTTKRTIRRTTVTEKKTVEHKRRTGPGGIYIPPPNQWFK